ncbi:MAG: hypothetical protein MZW92_25065 [Comamonadaceae bacterium]|nr:hypothetical protein [Comamonadaceae bacterium]
MVRSRGLAGLQAPAVTVEVHLANGLPSFTLVGLPDTEVKEARERVRAALQNNRYEFPSRRITVNLAPADLPKESGRFDLPIALGILAASGQIAGARARSLRVRRRTVAVGRAAPGARRAGDGLRGVDARAGGSGRRGFVLPAESADEAALVGGVPIFAARSLLQVVEHLRRRGRRRRSAQRLPSRTSHGMRPTLPAYPDLADVKGQAGGRARARDRRRRRPQRC